MTDQSTTPVHAPAVRLTDTRYDDPVAVELVAELQQEYVRRYGAPDEGPVQPGEFSPPDGVFLVARLDGADEPVGSVGLRRHGQDEVELKRMYIREAFRRRGLGRSLLTAVEERARALGYRRLILETGEMQPEAMALYASSGYARIENFGYYRDWPLSRCFGKDL